MNPPAPDQAERDQATDVSHSVIVQAPAGSGKTTLLVERFLKLLSIVEHPEEVLAITFTRKAASEMQNRISDALLKAATTPMPGSAADAALERSRALGWQLLEQPGRMKIQTIDSFAMSLIRQLPLTSGYDPSAELIDNAVPFYTEAASRLLMRLYSNDPFTEEIADFLEQCGNDAARAQRLLTHMLGKRDQWLGVTRAVMDAHRNAPDQVADVLVRSLMTLNDTVIGQFEQALIGDESQQLMELAGYAAGNRGTQVATRHSFFRLVADLLTTAKGTFRKQVTKRDGFPADQPEPKQRLKDLIGALSDRNLAAEVENLRFLPEPDLDADALKRLINVCVTLVLANSELNQVFRRHQKSDFTTLLLNAQAALGDELAPTDLALALDYRVHHILVDEFQDTSVSQFRLFEQLVGGWTPGDGNTFFAVGDPMQSIYRFRDADVGLFSRAWDYGIADVALETVVLTSNFRTHDALVRWTNSTFLKVMGTRQDSALGQIGYRPAVATRSWVLEEQPASALLFEDDASQINGIVSVIEQLIETSEGSIALLVRSRSQLEALIKLLRRRGISWHANDIDPLLDKPVVRDLLNILGAIRDPGDRLSWLSLMRMPGIGLKLTDLEALAGVRDFISFLESGCQATGLSDDGATRIARLAAAWHAISPHIDEQPPRSVLETFWLRSGAIDAYADPVAAVHATRLLDLVDSLGAAGLDAGLVEQSARDLFASDITDSRLEILTIHKAKGLEFDHVLIPFLEKTTPADETQLLHWRALPDGLLMGVRDDGGCYDWLVRENRYREKHERQRVFYVACTRARETLHLFATPQDNPPDNALLSFLWPLSEPSADLSIQHLGAAHIPAQTDLFDDSSDQSPPRLQRLISTWEWQPPEYPTLPPASHPETAATADVLDRRFEVTLGIVVHQALEQLSAQALPIDADDFTTTEHDHWTALAASHGIDQETAAQVADATAVQIRSVLSDATGRWLLEARDDAYAELSVTGVIADRIHNVIFDRTFRDGTTRWVVDFKTADPGSEVRAAFIRSEVSRYRAQLASYALLAESYFDCRPTMAIYFTAISHLEIVDVTDHD